MTVTELVLATANPDKAAEIIAVLGPHVELLPRPPDIPDVVEDGDTLVANARLKATAICRATGRPAVADDTGLEVSALGGRPGVHSARYAGEDASYADNVDKLLAELGDADDRSARFRTVGLIAWPDGRELVADGVVDGEIAKAPRGERGFGYDPIFVPAGSARTFAEMTQDAKRAISHRGRAFRALVDALGAVP